MFGARLIGMGWNDAFPFGALTNTRGLTELIALNVGYDLGVLPTPIVTILAERLRPGERPARGRPS